jgi:hypothetical protein
VTRSRRLALLAAALLGLAGCAHAPHQGFPFERISERFESARARREALLAAFTGSWMVRADLQGQSRLPALPATIQIASPDRVRLRVSALIGVGLDVLAANDSLYAWMPPRRLALSASGAEAGVGAPAAFVGRVLAATWAPPEAAWKRANRDSGDSRLGWREGGDSLALRVDDEAMPTEAWIGRGDRGVRIRYTDWTSVHGEPFPRRCELEDDSGLAHVRLEALEVRAEGHADPGWFTPRRVEGWKTMTWDDLVSMIRKKLEP